MVDFWNNCRGECNDAALRKWAQIIEKSKSGEKKYKLAFFSFFFNT